MVIIGAHDGQNHTERKQESTPNHKTPLKPIDVLGIKVDKLTVELSSVKHDIKILMDHINYKNKSQSELYTQKGWFW